VLDIGGVEKADNYFALTRLSARV